MSLAKEKPALDEQYYRLSGEFETINVQTKKREVFEKGEKFWWNDVHFVADQDGAKISRKFIRQLKLEMIPIHGDGTDVDLS